MTNNHKKELVKSCIDAAVDPLMYEVHVLRDLCTENEAESEFSRFECGAFMNNSEFEEFFTNFLTNYLSEIYQHPILGPDNPSDNPTELEQAEWLCTLATHNAESDFWDMMADFYIDR